MLRSLTFLLASCLLCLAGCDNVGRAFDPVFDPTGPNVMAGESAISVVQVGGDTKNARPKVKATFPTGSGWPTAVPIAVEFTESVNEASIEPTSPTGSDGRVVLRVKGTTQALPCQYDFAEDGRFLVMRPITALSNAQLPSYEVVLLPDARDCDGVTFDVPTTGTVLAEFQVNQAESITDGRILTVYPRDNVRDVPREAPFYVVFDRPANPATITATSLLLRDTAGTAVVGTRDYPLKIVGTDDPRVVRFQPTGVLSSASRFEFVVDDTITFGQDGTLDFGGKTPFSKFDTVGPAAPTSVELSIAMGDGFPNKVNISRIGTARLKVRTPADTGVGDRVRARIYGGDARTTATGDLAFVERTADVTADGEQDVELDFSGTLGIASSPKFDDGPLTFAVQMRRGSQGSGFIRNEGDPAPRFDVTPPQLMRVGPPASANGMDIWTDQESLSLFGQASEELSGATLTDTDAMNTPHADLFAGAADGRFLMQPLGLGRLAGSHGYQLNLVDSAGNEALATATGRIVQRGLLTGLRADTLTVEAFDVTTLAPIAGATVLVDPGAPTKPAASGQAIGMTDASGRVTFDVTSLTDWTVTIVRAGYDLVTVYQTSAAFVSLPLRPRQNATATLQGTLVFPPTPGATAIVSSSAFDDRSVLGVSTTTTAPSSLVDTPIVPNRPQVLTALGGAFGTTSEPTGSPGFTLQGYQLLGMTLTQPTPPSVPAAPGAMSSQNLTMIPTAGTTSDLLGNYQVDFAQASGLVTTDLHPRVRVAASLRGFTGQVVLGVGWATLASGGTFDVNTTIGNAALVGLAPLLDPLLIFVVTEAQDAAGRISRHRVSLVGQGVVSLLPPLAIPSITAPMGTSSGPPSVTFEDRLNPDLLAATVAISEVTASDPAGRRWVLVYLDRDAAGSTKQVQYPDLGAVVGLQSGTWSVVVEDRLVGALGTGSNDDFVLTARIHNEGYYSRSVAVPFEVQ